MKNPDVFPDYRFRMGMQKLVPYLRESSKCDVRDIEQISSEIVLRKRISLALLIAFIPFITALYLVASNIDVNKTYFTVLASIYVSYYFIYSIWACSSQCPTCGKAMYKRYNFIMPSLTCSHCGHDLKHPMTGHQH